MRLNTALVERTLSQFQAEAIPDDHPVIPQLNRLFGDHTYFIDSKGLNIVEPVDPASGTQKAQVVNVASWSEGNPNSLEPHEPEVTDVIVVLEQAH